MKPCTQSLDGSADNPFLSVSEGTGCRPPTNIAAGSRYLVSCIAVSQGSDLQPHHQLIVKPSKFDPDWFRMQIERFKRFGSMPLVGDEEFQLGGEVMGNVTESQRLATKAVMEALNNVPNLEVVLNTQEEGRQAGQRRKKFTIFFCQVTIMM